MGYRCDVRVATTVEAYEKIKELAPKYYADILRKRKVVEETPALITVEQDGMKVCYDKEFWLLKHANVYATTRDDKYIIFGWDDIKWMGYSYDDIRAIEKAFEDCGAGVHLVAIAEDGADENTWYGEEDYDMPFVETLRDWDFDSEWDMKTI